MSRATSFGISVVLIFAYYLFAFVMDALGLTEVVAPVIATWTPVLGFTGIGVFLLVRASR